MIDGNISMEEDTELRDLVVQTLENNGVLAKVRAELRASVFLTLEEQESVLNPEPFLNKSVKQYLGNPEGKLLFSLVREFLEYFGLDYTISVFDPETYFGKEYSYAGRKKLCEELGIKSREPLLGEILKNTINGALNNSQKDTSNIKLEKTNESSGNIANATFDISVPTIIQKDMSQFSVDISDKLDSVTNSDSQIPINVTITDKKQHKQDVKNKNLSNPVTEKLESSFSETVVNDKNIQSKIATDESNKEKTAQETNSISNTNNPITTQLEIHQNDETHQNKMILTEYQSANNVKNKKQIDGNKGKTVYFDEIIVDGMKEKISGTQENELLGDLPPLPTKSNSVFGDLPPLNGNRANMNDLKELMDIAQGVSQYDEDLTSSASGSASEQSPIKIQNIPESSSKPRNDREGIKTMSNKN